MRIRFELPPESRNRVEAERLRAFHALKQDVQGLDLPRRNVSFIRCVMRIFIAFVREACEFAKQSRDWAWSDSQLDQRCREFLLETVAAAWREKGRDLSIRELASHDPFGKIYLDDHARRMIKETPEWQQYEEMLLEALEAQSAGATNAAGANSNPGLTGEPAPELNVTAPAKPQPATVANDGEGESPRTLGTDSPFPARAAWVRDRLRERSWNKHDVSRKGGPDHKTVQKIIDGMHVREDVLEKLVNALSKAHASKKLPQLTLLDIPQG